MEKTKNGATVKKALMMGTTLVALNALAIEKAGAVDCLNCTMSAIILTPIVFAQGTNGLDFDRITETAVGTMVMDVADMRTAGGGFTAVGGAATGTSGDVSLTGATGVNIVIDAPAAPFTVTDGGGNTMTVNTFNLGTGAGVLIGALPTTLTMTASPTIYNVGATLTSLVSPQAPGTYTGNYTIRANYQ